MESLIINNLQQQEKCVVSNEVTMASVVSVLTRNGNLLNDIKILMPKLALHFVENPGKT